MTHGIMEYSPGNLERYVPNDIRFVDYERREIRRRHQVSKILYRYVCHSVSPVAPVAHQLMEANILKPLATEYTYDTAHMLQKLLGAEGF